MATSTKPRKCDTRIIQSGYTLEGHGIYCVYTADRERMLFGPARRKDCVAWRKENTA